MLAYLKGTVSFMSPVADDPIAEVWIDVHGLGYKVYVARCLASGFSRQKEITVYLSSSSALYGGEVTLYGFLSLKDIDLFGLLRDLPGVGAKKALEYFDKIKAKSSERFLEAIVRGDSKILASFFGFSPKTATKILAQLKDKAQDLLTSWQAPSRATLSLSKQKSEGKLASPWIDGHLWEQARGALVALGFDIRDAETALTRALAQAPDLKVKEHSAESLVKDALKGVGAPHYTRYGS